MRRRNQRRRALREGRAKERFVHHVMLVIKRHLNNTRPHTVETASYEIRRVLRGFFGPIPYPFKIDLGTITLETDVRKLIILGSLSL